MNNRPGNPSNLPRPDETVTDPDDKTLVERSRAGDTTAFDELVTRYRNKVYALAYNMVRNEDEAWDLAQEAFVKAWRSLDKFRAKSSFFTWLYRIVMNVSIDAIRHRKNAAEIEFDETALNGGADPASATTPAAEPLPHRNLEAAELRAKIDLALKKLSPEHRAAIVLKEIEGLQYHEIAESLGCSIGTVMSRLFYARRKLQTMLRDAYESL